MKWHINFSLKSQNHVVWAERGQEMLSWPLVINWLGFLVISSLEITVTYLPWEPSVCLVANVEDRVRWQEVSWASW